MRDETILSLIKYMRENGLAEFHLSLDETGGHETRSLTRDDVKVRNYRYRAALEGIIQRMI